MGADIASTVTNSGTIDVCSPEAPAKVVLQWNPSVLTTDAFQGQLVPFSIPPRTLVGATVIDAYMDKIHNDWVSNNLSDRYLYGE
ncbi:hypothetical protein N7454_009623 [Penicillium verhagenii]|nr:hypothetical protein N7454_009623 [Penicillium verhagenii]